MTFGVMYRKMEKMWERNCVWGKKDAVDFRRVEFEGQVEYLSGKALEVKIRD